MLVCKGSFEGAPETVAGGVLTEDKGDDLGTSESGLNEAAFGGSCSTIRDPLRCLKLSL